MRGLEAEEKILALEVHNKLRAKLANGLELRGNPGPQPSASNMMQLVSFTLRQDHYLNLDQNLNFSAKIQIDKLASFQ